MAIPAAMWKEYIPAGFVQTSDFYHLSEPVGEGYDSDEFCEAVYEKWWKIYLSMRLARFKSRGQTTEPWSFINDPFTEYLDTIPVESFAAEAVRPFGRGLSPGWRKKNWACITGCQDIRTTVEWFVAILIDGTQHVRAMVGLGFACEEGLIAWPYEGPSRREPESPSAVQSVLAFLPKFAPSLTVPIRIEGDDHVVLKKCRCIKPTESQRVKAEVFTKAVLPKGSVHVRRNSNKQASKKRKQDEEEPREEPPPMRARKTVPQVVVEHTIREDDLDKRVDAWLEEMPMPDPMSCFDFDFPDLGSFDLPEAPPTLDLPDEEVETATAFLQAALAGFDEQEQWYNYDPGQSSNDPTPWDKHGP